MKLKSLLVPGIAAAGLWFLFRDDGPVRAEGDTSEHRDRNGVWWIIAASGSEWVAGVDSPAPAAYVTKVSARSQEELRMKIDNWAVSHAELLGVKKA
jgi:hypothetical protein